jgi:phage shock protein A
MGMFARLARLIKSNINALISSSEDPEKMLNQLVRDMTEQLALAKKQVAGAIADEKRLARQVEGERAKASEWEKKAMLAVRAGNDALAKEALARRKEHESLGAQLQDQWQKQKTAVDQLKLALRALNNKIEEAKRKKNILIARKKRAEAHKQIASTMHGLSDNSAFDTFDRMSDRINLLEAEAEASSELAGELSGDSLESQFLQLESGGHGTEDEALNELKAKMGMLKAGDDVKVKQLEAPSASSLSEEDLKELEDLDLSSFESDDAASGKSSDKS